MTLDSLTQEAAPFITVVEKGTYNGTTSEMNGYFFLCVNVPSTLQLSAIGYKKREIVITEDIIKNQPFLNLLISEEEMAGIVIVKMGICGPRPKEIYPTLELITDLSFVERIEDKYITMRCHSITDNNKSNNGQIFYMPTENQLKFLLTNNR